MTIDDKKRLAQLVTLLELDEWSDAEMSIDELLLRSDEQVQENYDELSQKQFTDTERAELKEVLEKLNALVEHILNGEKDGTGSN